MASSVRFGSTTVLNIPPEVISRRNGIICDHCPKELSEEEIAISKKRGNKPVKYYCTECALLLNIISKEEYLYALEELNAE